MCTRRATTLLAAFSMVVLLAGCGSSGNDSSTAASAPVATAASSTPSTSTTPEAVPAVVKVSIGDNFYKPESVTIQRGQSVSWRNAGAVAHTVTSDDNSSLKFDSGSISPSAGYVLKPGAPGTITYYCTIHGKSMSGTITVTR